MLRIGIAASKMSKGSLLNYNLCVILIACLFSLFIFLICGVSIFLIVLMISILLNAFRPSDVHMEWAHMLKPCLIILAVVVVVFNVIAIFKNVQWTKKKI